jgi:hypothetical protein
MQNAQLGALKGETQNPKMQNAQLGTLKGETQNPKMQNAQLGALKGETQNPKMQNAQLGALKGETRNPTMQNAQLGALKGETQNLGPKLITSSTKQIVQGDGQKTWKDTKLRRGLSHCHNWQMQDSGGLNSLKAL